MPLELLGNGEGLSSSNSVRDLIVRVLCDEWPLTARQVHERIKRSYALGCSYQAVFKQVKELVEKGILDFDGKLYQVNIEWVEKVCHFAVNLKEHYAKNPEGNLGAGYKFTDEFGKKRRIPA